MTATYDEFAGKVAVVTGAARGIGAALTEGLAAQGVQVVGADVDLDAMSATATRLSRRTDNHGEVVPGKIDVAVRSEHTALASIALNRFGRLDYWINNAGVCPDTPILETQQEQLDSTFRVNVDGVLFGAQAAAEAIGERGGAILNMASLLAFKVRPPRVAYSVSKAAVDHLTRLLSIELAERGLRVNAIAPGTIKTDMTRWLEERPGAMETTLRGIPLGRIGQPEDIVNAALFLLSDSASYITGTTLMVDGGSRNFS